MATMIARACARATGRRVLTSPSTSLRLPHTARTVAITRRFSSDGKKRSDPEWRGALSPLEYDVLRQAGTERPFTGEHTSVFPSSGHYACKGCGTALYSSESKFEASCGWPAFDKAYKGTVRVRLDSTHGMTRWEILCAACDGHLGHVFTGEGYTPTSQRHCVNSVSMVYTEDEVESPETAFDFAAYGSGTDTN